MSNNTKHTPGPWKTRHNEKSWTIRAEYELVTKIEDLNSSSEANAHLIAAAPEMYRVLEQCLEISKAFKSAKIPPGIETLLAKARGES